MSEQAPNKEGNEGGSVTVALPDANERFTLVFVGNLRKFQGNPLRTETPFGIAVVCGLGDAFEKIDELETEIERLV